MQFPYFYSANEVNGVSMKQWNLNFSLNVNGIILLKFVWYLSDGLSY